MARGRYVREPGAKKGTYLPCPRCGFKNCKCVEIQLLAALEQAGLPDPDGREFAFASPHREWRADFYYLESRILIEVEGGGAIGRHTSATGYREDCIKYNVAASLGWKVLRFDKALITRGVAVDQIRAALQGLAYVPKPTKRPKTTGKSPAKNARKNPSKNVDKNAQKRTKTPEGVPERQTTDGQSRVKRGEGTPKPIDPTRASWDPVEEVRLAIKEASRNSPPDPDRGVTGR